MLIGEGMTKINAKIQFSAFKKIKQKVGIFELKDSAALWESVENPITLVQVKRPTKLQIGVSIS